MCTTGSAAIGLAVAVAAFLTSSCATTRPPDWTNHNISEVVKELGPPTAILSQVIRKPGQPTQILPCPDACVYYWQQTKTTITSTFGSSSDPHGGSYNSTSCLMSLFSVARDGTITHYEEHQLPWVCDPFPPTAPPQEGLR